MNYPNSINNTVGAKGTGLSVPQSRPFPRPQPAPPDRRPPGRPRPGSPGRRPQPAPGPRGLPRPMPRPGAKWVPPRPSIIARGPLPLGAIFRVAGAAFGGSVTVLLAQWAIENWGEIQEIFNSPVPPMPGDVVMPSQGWKMVTYGGNAAAVYPVVTGGEQGGGLTKATFKRVIYGDSTPGNGNMKWSSNTWVPDGVQPAPYLAAIGAQYIGGTGQVGATRAGLWQQQDQIGANGRFRHVASFYEYGTAVTDLPPYPSGWPSPLFVPWFLPSWVPNVFPPLTRPGAMPGAFPVGKPLNLPRPDPWSPESPDVGPRPGTPQYPAPAPSPTPSSPWEPVPAENPLPEGWEPAPVPHAPPRQIQSEVGAAPQNFPNAPPRTTSPPKGTKESKGKMSRAASWAWHAIGGLTEGVDFVNNLYESLPRDLKRKYYKKYGRQPNPIERLQIIYLHINDVNIGDAVKGYIKQQIDDMISAAGSDKIAKANRIHNRPIGYEAGPALGGGFDLPGPEFLWQYNPSTGSYSLRAPGI